MQAWKDPFLRLEIREHFFAAAENFDLWATLPLLFRFRGME